MIGAVIAAALPVLRANAQSLMTSTCTIERAGTEWDAEAKKTVATWTPVHTDLPCHVEEPSATSRQVLTGQTATLEAPVVKVAHDVTGVQPDDRVTVAGMAPMWVTLAAHDDSTHPVELLIQCRRVR